MKTIPAKAIAVLLWVITLGLGLLDIYVSQFITLSAYARFVLGNGASATPTDIAAADTLRITTILIGALLYVIFLISTSEYHFRHLTQPSSWRLLGISIGVELVIILIAAVFGPVSW
jgi:hypothetical protein